MTEEAAHDSILVQVVDVSTGRGINWGGNAVEKLSDRVIDVRTAIVAGVRAVAIDLDQSPPTGAWSVSELSATFGLTLAAEAGVVLSKASTEATFEVTVTLRRDSAGRAER